MKSKRITYAVELGLIGFVAVVGIQLYTVVEASDQERAAAVVAWEESNPGKPEVVARYRKYRGEGTCRKVAHSVSIRSQSKR